ncbi:MAG: hypothetical protein Kow0074_15090 [Candidatus Zixiibacteriota bacterium]
MCYGIASLCAITLGAGCAQKGAPQGGPPDTTAPQVVRTVPGSGAVNVDVHTPFEIEFSEAVEKTKFLANFYVSPKRTGAPMVDWSGRIARITWRDSLREDITYRVTVGSRLTDIHNNPLSAPYTFAFSTGERIDSGRVRGQVWQDMAPAVAYDVLAYMLDSGEWDPAAPDFQTQTNDSGRFDLPYLPDAVFRVLAVQDKNANGRPDHGEFVAIAPNEVRSLASGAVPVLDMHASLYDTLPFAISGCTVGDDGSILIGFSHAIDTSRWTSEGLIISDSINGNPVPVDVLAPVPPRFTIVPAVPQSRPEAGRVLRVAYIPNEDDDTHRTLSVGGKVLAACSSYVTYPKITDTIGVRVQSTEFPTATMAMTPDAPIRFGFSEPVALSDAAQVLKVFDSTGQTIAGNTTLADPRQLIFTPETSWPDTTTIVVTLDSAALVDRHGNPAPTQTFSWTFPPLTPGAMGDAALRVRTSDSTLAGLPVIILARSARDDRRSRWTLSQADSITVTLPAGEWLFGAFWDMNANGRFDPGQFARRFELAEPRTTYPDTVSIRARFTVEDIILEF